MQLTNAIAVVDELQESEGSVTGPSALSAMERIFCDVFVANGGNGEEAAIAAGYAEGSAKVSACRLLCRKRVQERIEFLCKTFLATQAPVAIHTVVKAAGDEKALWKDRLKAATCILDRAGLAAPKEGTTINVGVAVNGQQAQAIIASVHNARQARLSDIPPAMPDTLREDMDTLEGEVQRLETDHPGGDQLQGPGTPELPLPPHPSEHCDNSDVSPPGAVDAFRAAFDDEGED